MNETIPVATKFTSILMAFTLFFTGAGLYELTGTSATTYTPITSTAAEDPFISDIQHRSDLVYNAVNEVIVQRGQQNPITYKQTWESSLSFIRSERLDTNANYNMLSEDQKELVQNYRAYLKEASNVVVSVGYNGETVDLSKMNETKAKLY